MVTQPIYTSVSDALGRKVPLYAAFLLFTIGAVVFATAQDMAVLILGRVLQGLGGGGLDVLQEIILADMTTLKERSLYLGLITLPLAVGTILGPVVGALFSEFVSWRWIGWSELPCLPFLYITVVLLQPAHMESIQSISPSRAQASSSPSSSSIFGLLTPPSVLKPSASTGSA